jgi:hypothetical protein
MKLRDTCGSLTLEALLILPIIIICLVGFIKLGQGLWTALVQQNELVDQAPGKKFKGPAESIRQADLWLDWGRGLQELLPTW